MKNKTESDEYLQTKTKCLYNFFSKSKCKN